MNVLSLFDGISCGHVALERAGIKVDNYFASEIDKYAIQITQKNYPETKQLGDVNNFEEWDLPKIDLLIGGSPCQDLSICKKDRKGLDGERSGLFWKYVECLHKFKPKYFLLENVASMSKEAKQKITDVLGVEPILINSALVSAQQRKRLYWTNIPGVKLPEDKNILLKDILISGLAYLEKSQCIVANYHKAEFKNSIEKKQRTMVAEPVIVQRGHGFNKGGVKKEKSPTLTANGCYQENNFVAEKICVAQRGRYLPDGSTEQQYEPRYDGKTNSLTTVQKDNMIIEPVRIGKIGKGGQGDRIYSIVGKSVSLNANGGGRGAKTGLYKIDLPDGDYIIRKLHPIECERLQTLPDNYTEGISNSQRYKCLGNGWTADVIAHIFGFINGGNYGSK